MSCLACVEGGKRIPCKHACSVINNSKLNPSPFVSHYYTSATYKLTYELNIAAMSDPSQWAPAEVPMIAPPRVKKTVGTPFRNRKMHLVSKGRGRCLPPSGIQNAISLDITRGVAWEV